MKWILLFLSCLLWQLSICQSRISQASQAKVITDGINSKGEWKEANRIQINQEFTVYLMADSTWFYLAVFSYGAASHYTDLYLSSASLINVHASMQLGERQLPLDGTWNDESPAWNWGNNKNWVANKVNYKSNASEGAPFLKQIIPYHGQEFRISRSKLHKDFRLLILVRDFIDAAKQSKYPVDASLNDTTTWLEIEI